MEVISESNKPMLQQKTKTLSKSWSRLGMYNVELDMIKHMYTARIKTQQTMKKQNKKQTKTTIAIKNSKHNHLPW